MKLLVATLMILGTADSIMKINFGSLHNQTDWYVINDGVMGGLSESQVGFNEDSFIFKGEVSLQNNGGFSSIRSPFETYDLSDFSAVEIKYKATGYDFAFNLATSKVWYRPVYRAPILDSEGEWITKVFKLSDFNEVVVGKKTGDKLPQEMYKDVIRLGFITNEKRAGKFLLEVDYIKFVK
ncbi:MAG: CIA30 family protein [Gilvibacter sp.]